MAYWAQNIILRSDVLGLERYESWRTEYGTLHVVNYWISHTGTYPVWNVTCRDVQGIECSDILSMEHYIL